MKRFLTLFFAALVSLAAAAGNGKYVNMFMGTAGDHGQVSPAAQVPFGLASVCPDCYAKDRHAGYDFEVTQIKGISVTRMSGTGGDGTGGNLRIFPALPGTPLHIIKETETASPGYYATSLTGGIKVEATATKHCAVERYTFPKAAEKVLFIDFNSAIDPRRSACSFSFNGSGCIQGWVETSTVCNFGQYKLWFRIETDQAFTVEELGETTALLRFGDITKKVEVRISLSSIGPESATEGMSAVSGRSFNAVRRDAEQAWDKVLGKVDVEGSTQEQRTLFYTSLYRVCLSPFDATFGGLWKGSDGKLHTAGSRTFYSGWSMWDTFRTKFPMLTLLFPERMSDICFSLVELYKAGKLNWATMTEPVPTVRTEHSQVTLLDASVKGIGDFDMASAFKYMEAEADAGRTAGARNGLLRNSPDQRMETVYDLWAMSRIASDTGNVEAAARYAQEVQALFEETWKSEFMNIDDTYTLMKGNGLYQGTRWQYRWAVPVYADKMKEWAGEETLAGQLEEFFRRSLFNQGNEPDIHTPFMFHLFGRPQKTAETVLALLTDDKMMHLYGGNAEFPKPFVGRAFRDRTDGYAPEMDEDDGTMSAWYMFAQMGFYPTCPGTPDYALFTPLFSKVVLHLKGHDVTILRRCDPARAGRVTVDGEPLDYFTISHQRLCNANKIIFE